MKYNLVLAVTPLLACLVAADAVPPGATHQSKWGNAIVENHCSETVYYVFDNQPSRNSISSGGKMSVPMYIKNADGGGGSIKLFTKQNLDLYANPQPAVTQFEFTPTDNQYTDISNVNSNIGNGMNGNGLPCSEYPPFMQGGMRLAFPGSPDIVCSPGANPCKTAYSANDDNFATTASKLGADITLTLCPGGGSVGGSSSGSSSGGSGGQSSAAPASSAAPVAPVVEQKLAVKPPPPSATPVAPAPAPKKEEEVVWVTHVEYAAPAVETVFVDGSGHHKEKRSEHLHKHAHNNKRRHGA